MWAPVASLRSSSVLVTQLQSKPFSHSKISGPFLFKTERHTGVIKFQFGSGCGDSLVKAVGHALLRSRHPISKRLICQDSLTHPALDIEIEVPFRHKTCFGFHGKTHKMIHNLWNVQCPLMDRQRSHIPEP